MNYLQFRKVVLLFLILGFSLSRNNVFALPSASFELADPGTESVVDYTKFGEFKDLGTAKYKYQVNDNKGLAAAVGEGIFPNNSVTKDQKYKDFTKAKKLLGSHWSFVNSSDYEAAFYKWSTAPEEQGVKQFYTAEILEKAGLIGQAVKAYYATAVFFPKSMGVTYWKTPWYVGPAALDRVIFLTRKYPELGMKLVDARIAIENRYDDDLKNDIFSINPGRLIKVDPSQVIEKKIDLSAQKIAREKVYGNVTLTKYENGDWQLKVDGKPFLMKSIAYQPSKIGESPDIGTLEDWSFSDANKNNKIDGPYDAWIDKNRDNIQEGDEPAVGDFQIMKDMGINVVRVYHHDFVKNKAVFEDLYKNYGIRIIIGDFLGMYAVGSKAPWNPGTDYSNPVHQSNMLDSVMRMVNDYKDEPCVLMWVLGNENNYGTANNSGKNPEAYYHFVNEVAKKIKEVDPNHPVAICNGDIHFLDIFAANCPDIDVFGVNAYRGKHGFGYYSLWLPIKEVADKPAMITESGCPSYGYNYTREQAEDFQADYLVSNWQDIVQNSAGFGAGNALGGVIFEYLDEWWKTGAPPGFPDIIQDVTPNCGGPFLDGWYYEEWFGVISQGDGTDSPFMRQLKKSYFALQKVWVEK